MLNKISFAAYAGKEARVHDYEEVRGSDEEEARIYSKHDLPVSR